MSTIETVDSQPTPIPTLASAPVWSGDPSVLGLPVFLVGSVALGLTLVGYVPAEAVGAPLAIIVAATGVGLVIAAVWAAALGQSVVSAVFGIFAGFWLSYAGLVLGLTHNWFGIPPAAAVKSQELFLLSWVLLIGMLTAVTLRLPSAFTLLFGLVDLALLLALLSTVNSSVPLERAAGGVVFAFVAVGFYLFVNAASAATGGLPLPLGRPVLTS